MNKISLSSMNLYANIRLLLTGFVLVMLLSCNKYEEGPRLSLRTRKGRISNKWMIEKALYNNIDKTDSLNTFRIEFIKSGDLYYKTFESGDTTTFSGVWALDADARNIILAIYDNDVILSTKIWEILKLKTSELWVRELMSNNTLEYHFISVK